MAFEEFKPGIEDYLIENGRRIYELKISCWIELSTKGIFSKSFIILQNAEKKYVTDESAKSSI